MNEKSFNLLFSPLLKSAIYRNRSVEGNSCEAEQAKIARRKNILYIAMSMTTTMISSFNSKALNCVLWNTPKFSSPPPNLFSSTKRRRLQQIRKKKKAHDQATVSTLISSTAVDQTTTLPVELTALVTVRKSLKLSIQDMMLHWFGNHDHFSHHKEKEKCLVLQLVSTETEAGKAILLLLSYYYYFINIYFIFLFYNISLWCHIVLL